MKKSLGAKTLAVPTPVWVVGSYGDNGEPNIMTAAWGGICCGVPPCIAISVQKIRATHHNIVQRKAYTVSIPSQQYLAEADYAGLVSGKNIDKFIVSGLTSVRSELVDAPYVQEFPLILECQLLHTIEIGIHTQFIGEIIDVKADEIVLGENGLPILEKVNPFCYSQSERLYYGIGNEVGKAYSAGLKLSR